MRRLTGGALQLILLATTTSSLAAQTPYETTRIADGVYQFRWQGHNGMFVVGDGEVAVFDPIGVEPAHRFAAEIQRVAPGLPLAAIVYSHSDADHATGAGALISAMGGSNVPIIAHEAAVAPIRERGDPDQPLPTVTFAERMTFLVGGREVQLHYLGPSHTDNMIVPFVPDVGVAFAVDFVSNDRMGYQDLPGWHFPAFYDALAGLLRIPFDTMVFGHGPPGGRDAIQRQIAYYDDLTAAVRDAVARGWSEDQAATGLELPRYSDWDQYEAWFPLNVRGVYRWVAASR